MADHLLVQRPFQLPHVVECGPNLNDTIAALPDLTHVSFLIAEDGTMLRVVRNPGGNYVTDNTAMQELGFRTHDPDVVRGDPKNNG